ncbi:avt5, partial [Symbiodinium microadriaticum]
MEPVHALVMAMHRDLHNDAAMKLLPASDAEAKEKLRKFGKVAIIGFGIASVQYALVMVFGFLTFGKAATGNVLLNYDNLDPWAAAARVAVGLSTLFGYPMQFAGFRDGILEVFKIDALKTGPHRLATASLLAVAVGIACVFRDLGQFQALAAAALAGSLCAAFEAQVPVHEERLGIRQPRLRCRKPPFFNSVPE